MNSLKNTVVIVLLLGVSYGVFQLVNSPKPNVAKEEEPDEISIVDESGDDGISESNSMPMEQTLPNSQQAPPLVQQDEFPQQLNPPPAAPNQFPPVLNSDIDNGNGAELPGSPMELSRSGSDFRGPLDNAKPANTIPAGQQFEDPNNLVDVGQLNTPPVRESNTNLLGNHSTDQNENFNQLNGNMSFEQPKTTAVGLEQAYTQATSFINQGNMSAALKTLSAFYHADMSEAKRQELLTWLDSLAGKVIYSPEHLLDSNPYIVREGDSIRSIAQSWNVPAMLVYKINETTLRQGQFESGLELKQLKGPFRAEVNLSKNEMTMFLGDLYAGRFALDFGNDVAISEGEYRVQTKSEEGQLYRDAQGNAINPATAENPYGKYWMDLGGGICIHSRATNDQRGCIRVGQNQVGDVFTILSPNSPVKIVR